LKRVLQGTDDGERTSLENNRARGQQKSHHKSDEAFAAAT
jgi:hypothetical protein